MTDSTHSQLVQRQDEDGVAVLTINQPEKLNAASRPVLETLAAHLDDIEVDSNVDAIIITGQGDTSFVAGADIHELAKRAPLDALESYMQRLYDRIAEFPKPTIAAVNGYALGGGNELAMACDIRIASPNAIFGLPETGLGILPAAGGTQRLAKLVGVGVALDIIITGRRLNAEEALRWGLVNYVVEQSELLDEAHKIAQRIRRKGITAVALVREVLQRGSRVDHQTGMLLERLAQGVLYATAEKQEGTKAFLEKRHPDFRSVRGEHGLPQN
ncbi:enoyl-CoA hydratase-related protein [Corynebacterium sp. 153RC1]|uniref:enoyl-CoA hydratase/isomerase family protein n=1 Tax=Corynebacterium TaxID=1716 RepID=UPI00211BF7F5|nr:MULTISPECIES: enoyl-CoA hydratase-related protein [unclassified Corynebacterium]MCQ9342998.1 enoyl-CoA hydratase-related protein [Corynebacterium sp. 76QC2CO]MCQ9352713.1 enoyl-CoA hydratase-related protein [Corynebacterium sp. 209RC1]MCQ9354897.1 enoyl-CoA hydratase-related protein [Corynebacterium sp. 1222RC1]MCQ9357082.1 enoyl-CoA hydratase-related protein [Corynebacterium sp. 122RC1]MCQ9359328.1 enoyl-CoA hydratase-related protein [Corynebacterium sp. 142RC1]